MRAIFEKEQEMPRVICTLQNASTLINGIAFVAHKLGMISEEVEEDIADVFLAIDGYLSHDDVKSQAIAAAATGAAVVPGIAKKSNAKDAP